MKTVFATLLLLSVAAGCQDNPDVLLTSAPVPGNIVETEADPTKIDGLELTFREIDVSYLYTSVLFTNETTGYITSIPGAIIKTTDGGASWADLNVDNLAPLQDLFFLNDNEGWAAGGTTYFPVAQKGAVIFHTTDGGASWSKLRPVLTKLVELSSVWFINANTGFAAGDNLIIRTTDGGKTWTETSLALGVDYNTPVGLRDLTFVDDRHGVAGTTDGKIVRTEDGGDTWTVSDSFNETGFTAVDLGTDNVVYASGQKAIYHSSDYGKTWNQVPVYPTWVNTLRFVTSQTGFAFGVGDSLPIGDDPITLGSIFYTLDGGQTWKGTSKIHEMSRIVSASFPTERTGYGISGDRLVKITLK